MGLGLALMYLGRSDPATVIAIDSSSYIATITVRFDHGPYQDLNDTVWLLSHDSLKAKSKPQIIKGKSVYIRYLNDFPAMMMLESVNEFILFWFYILPINASSFIIMMILITQRRKNLQRA